MGLYDGVLPCGCVQCTSTMDYPPVTYTIKYCDLHKPKEVQPIKNDDNDKKKSEAKFEL